MNDDRESKVLAAANESLDQSVDTMPDELTSALAAARAKALASVESSDAGGADKSEGSKVVQLRAPLGRTGLVWGGAIAASCAALTLSFVLRQPGSELLPLDVGVEGTYALEAEDSMLFLAEMDNTEWELVQELEFALWLSEFGDEASADFSG